MEVYMYMCIGYQIVSMQISVVIDWKYQWMTQSSN